MISRVLSLFRQWYARYQAWRRDIPYKFDRLWIAGKRYMADEDELFRGRYELMSFRGRGSTGDVFGLLREGGRRHLYEITSRHHPGGSDHFISPYEYSLRYVGTMTEEEYQQHQERIEQQQEGPRLLQIW